MSDTGTREAEALALIERVRARPARFKDRQITMAHGAGGKATQTLIAGLFVPAFGGAALRELGDAGVIEGLALTTDSFVVKPIRFPGGSIGDLAVNGTVNDLAVAGARPLALTLSLVLEEGLSADDLRGEIEAITAAAASAGVEIVAGDTKVVERGRCDSMYVTTTGPRENRPARGALDRRDRAGRQDPRLRPDRRARHGGHARARRVRARGTRRIGHALPLARGRRDARGRRALTPLPVP